MKGIKMKKAMLLVMVLTLGMVAGIAKADFVFGTDISQQLAEFLRQSGAADASGRDMLAEIAAGTPRTSHHLPGDEMPEDYWVYRYLKRRLFFGMGGYG